MQGHVDAASAPRAARGRLRPRRDDRGAGGLLRYVVEKGSIAVDGVSLTVAVGDERLLGVAHPRDARADEPRRGRSRRAPVNLEVDVLAKYVEKLVGGRMRAGSRTIEEAIEDIRAGQMVVVCDDEDRENEGDLTMAAQFVTPEAINFMATHGRGLICLALTPERCDELGLDLMAAKNESPFQTAFTVSIEARDGVTTGISAADRARTIQVAIDPQRGRATSSSPATSSRSRPSPAACSSAPARPRRRSTSRGSRADPGRRDLRGHERRRDDGAVPDLVAYCERHGLKMITVADLIAYRRKHDKLVERVVETRCRPRSASSRRRLPLAGRREAPRRAGQGRGGRARTCSSACTPSA